MSPPVLPVLPIRIDATSASASTVARLPRDAPPGRCERQSTTTAAAPVAITNQRPSIAAPSCRLTSASEIPAWPAIMRSAPTPLTNVGIVSNETTAKMMSELRRRSSLLPVNEATNKPTPTKNPMIGT